MQSGRWLCIGPQVARLRPSSRADILLETRPLIFSGFFSGPPRVVARAPEGNQAGGRWPLPSAAPPSPSTPQKKQGAAEQTKRVGFVGAPEQAKTDRTGGWGLVLLCLDLVGPIAAACARPAPIAYAFLPQPPCEGSPCARDVAPGGRRHDFDHVRCFRSMGYEALVPLSLLYRLLDLVVVLGVRRLRFP